jgi:mannose/fructose/N-acetylgalactosamine-specific phosphotransferase system component IID
LAHRMSAATLPRGLVSRVYLRSLALQASWNDERMQNLGLLVALAPWLRGQDLNVAVRRRFCQRHIGVFNTNPYLANLVIGGLLRLESEVSPEGHTPTTTSVAAFRDTLARVCGSLGDQLFWLGLRPGLAMLTILLGFLGQWPLLLAVVVLFGVAQLLARGRWLTTGYALGLDIVELLSRPAWHRAIRWTKRGALALTGVLAGIYVAGIMDAKMPGLSVWCQAAGAVVGFALPLLLRQRLPGEAQALVGLLLACGAVLLFD